MYWYVPWTWTFSFWEEILSGARFVATELTADDLDAAAELHSEVFDRPWTGDEIAALLSQDNVFGYVVRRVGQPNARPAGFVLVRMAADEAEILTVAVHPRARRQGIGRLLMDSVLQRLYAERIGSLFLEVDEENEAALALYGRLRFREVARRPAYYIDEDGRKTSALVLKRDLH